MHAFSLFDSYSSFHFTFAFHSCMIHTTILHFVIREFRPFE